MQQEYTIDKKVTYNTGATLTVTVTLPMSLGFIDDVFIVTESNREKKSFKLMFDHVEGDNVIFKHDIFLRTTAACRYFFTFTADGRRKYMGSDKEVADFLDYRRIDKLSVNYEVPEWAKGAVMYQIFVDSFNRGQKEPMKPMRGRVIKSWDEPRVVPFIDGEWCNDFYGGDLKGITEKLDYLKDLGIDVLYLTPVVYGQSNHRYDAVDYETVDPYLGKNEDLKELCDEAHKRGMRIIVDGVFNHTGNDSKYFNQFGNFDTVGACQDINSYYGTFYKSWYNGDETFFNYWYGMKNLPECDGYSLNWHDYIYGEGGVVDKWCELGIDGIRLDVADCLEDNFIEGVRNTLKKHNKDAILIGEIWRNAMHENRGYISSGRGLDSQMNYPLADALMRYFRFSDVNKARGVIQDLINEYPKDMLNALMNFTSTHDITRAINIFGSSDFREDSEYAWTNIFECNQNPDYFNNFKLSPGEYQKGKDILEAYSFLLNFMPGMFSIFYGDEAGLTGMGNILNRVSYKWNDRDEDLVEYFKTIFAMRKEQEFLKNADLNIVDVNNHYIMLERTSNEADALVTVNRTNEDCGTLVPEKYETNNKVYSLKKSTIHRLTPYGGTAIIKK